MKLLRVPCLALLLTGSFNAMAADPLTEADFTFDASTSFHKAVIVAGANILRAENPKCATLDPASVELDYNRGNPENPAFSVLCGDGADKGKVYFTNMDVEAAQAKARQKK